MTAADIAQLTRRVLALNEQLARTSSRLSALAARIESVVRDTATLHRDLGQLYLGAGGPR